MKLVKYNSGRLVLETETMEEILTMLDMVEFGYAKREEKARFVINIPKVV